MRHRQGNCYESELEVFHAARLDGLFHVILAN
jgi:hypothetical protein